MADEVDSGAKAPSNDQTPGALLRAARKEQGRSTRDIAATLNMDAWMLDAIERDEYAALGAPVFAKGHLRKYAGTLGIDPDDLMVGYYELAGPREAPPLIADSILRAEAARPVSFAWVFPTVVVAAAVVAVAAAAMWYLRTEPPAVPATPEVTDRDRTGDGPVRLPLPATTSEPRADDGVSRRRVPLPAAGSDAADDSAERDPGSASGNSTASGPQSLAEPSAAAPAGAGASETDRRAAAADTPEPAPVAAAIADMRLTLRFRTDSWVEVYDAERRKMLYGMGEAGTTQNLSGLPPLQVFLGRYSGVDVEVNGRPFTIPRAARRSNTARFRIEQPSG